jgi:hypothetical protein
MSEILLKLLDSFGLAYWAEIKTENPKCIYYFGPFATLKEANDHHSGYLEDLTSEGAQEIKVDFKRCKPNQLTILEEGTEEEYPTKIINLTERSL